MGRSHDRKISEETVLVVGLGLFGSAVARSLKEMDVPLIAVTDDHARAVHYADDFTHVIEMDPSDQSALERAGRARHHHRCLRPLRRLRPARQPMAARLQRKHQRPCCVAIFPRAPTWPCTPPPTYGQ